VVGHVLFNPTVIEGESGRLLALGLQRKDTYKAAVSDFKDFLEIFLESIEFGS